MTQLKLHWNINFFSWCVRFIKNNRKSFSIWWCWKMYAGDASKCFLLSSKPEPYDGNLCYIIRTAENRAICCMRILCSRWDRETKRNDKILVLNQFASCEWRFKTCFLSCDFFELKFTISGSSKQFSISVKKNDKRIEFNHIYSEQSKLSFVYGKLFHNEVFQLS